MKNLFLIAILFISNLATAYKISDLKGFKNDLSGVTEIDFSNKGLIEFPSEILDCPNLQKLNLSDNGIMNIPIELSQLIELKTLDLSGNQGLSVLDLDELFKLAEFELDAIDLSDCELIYLPATIETQSKLKKINLSKNKLFKLPYGMMVFDQLIEINIAENEIEDISWLVSYWWSLKKIDVSDNNGYLTSALLLSLSYFDEINELIISDIDYIPSEFSFLNVDKLIIKNSFIDFFPRTEDSRPINKLIFDNCRFKNPEDLSKIINSSCKPTFLGFNNIPAIELVSFLSIETDSVSVKNSGIINVLPLIEVEKLQWLDLRGNQIEKSSVAVFKEKKPDVHLLYLEPVKANFGVKPPIQKFIQKPMRKSFIADKTVVVHLGKSVLTVPENSILDNKGNVFKGKVNLEYSEYINPAEIFLSGITMTSTVGDETLMLSSGGMINIEAKDDEGNSLSVNPEAPLIVKIFTENTDSKMKIWRLGENGSWENLGNDSIVKPFKINSALLDSAENRDFKEMAQQRVQYINNRYIPKVKRNRKLGTFELKFEELITHRLNKKITVNGARIMVPDHDYSADFLCGKSLVYNGDSVEYYYELFNDMRRDCRWQYKRLKLANNHYSEQGPNFITKLDLVPDFENDRFELLLKYKAQNIRIPVLYKPEETNSNVSIRNASTFYKDYVSAEKKTIKSRRRFKIKLRPILYKQEQKLKNFARQLEVQRQRALYSGGRGFEELTGQGSVQREFMMNGFGTFNCDVRSRMVNPKTIAKQLIDEQTMERIEEAYLSAMLIDHTTNGTLQFLADDKIFLDNASESTVIFFFTTTLVGIYQSWRNKITETGTQVQLLDISEVSREEFVQTLIADE